MHPRHLHPRRVGTITIRGRMSTVIRRVRIILGVLGLLSGAHARPHLVLLLVRPRDLLLVRPVAVACAAEVAAGAGEV